MEDVVQEAVGGYGLGAGGDDERWGGAERWGGGMVPF